MHQDGPGGGPALVVVVEDEPELADLYSEWLTDDYRVKTAYSGRQALKIVDAAVDVVLLDRRMPDISGDEVVGRIRERNIDCKVAMVTAVTPDFDILKLSVDEYLTKPVSKDELKNAVNELVTRSTLEDGLDTYLALASKKAALEAEKSGNELRNNTEYDILTTKLADRRKQFETELAQLAEGEPDTVLPYPTRQIVITGLLMSMVAVILIGVHFELPELRQRLLEFGYPDANLFVSYLLTFVHANDAHLYGNVIGYLSAAFFSYFLCMRIRAARWFYATTPLLMTVLPIGTTMLSQAVFKILYPEVTPVFIGFSTVVAGFVGFAFLAFLILSRTIHDHRTVLFIGVLIFLVSVDVLFVANHNPLLSITGPGTLLFLLFIAFDRRNSISRDTDVEITVVEQIVEGFSAAVFFTAFGLGLVPIIGIRGPDNIHVIGHLLGVFIGFVISFSTAFLVNLFPVRERI